MDYFLLLLFINLMITGFFFIILRKVEIKKAVKILKFGIGLKFGSYSFFSTAIFFHLQKVGVEFGFSRFYSALWFLMVLILDSLLLFRPIKRIRKIEIKFWDYAIRTIAEGALIFFPLLFFGTVNGALPKEDLINYIFIIAIIIGYNMLYPFLASFRYKACRMEENLRIEKIGELPYKCRFYLFDGKSEKYANVIVYGLFSPYRIFVSDLLFERLEKREIKAVIHHEMGHIEGHHSMIRVLFLIFSYILISNIGGWMDLCFPKLDFGVGATIIIMVCIFGVLFPYLILIKAQEYQADRVAVRQSGDKEIFIGALKKLDDLNDLPVATTKIGEMLATHPSLEKRITRINKEFCGILPVQPSMPGKK